MWTDASPSQVWFSLLFSVSDSIIYNEGIYYIRHILCIYITLYTRYYIRQRTFFFSSQDRNRFYISFVKNFPFLSEPNRIPWDSSEKRNIVSPIIFHSIYEINPNFFFSALPHSGQGLNLMRCGTHNISALVGDILPQGGQPTVISIARNKGSPLGTQMNIIPGPCIGGLGTHNFL